MMGQTLDHAGLCRWPLRFVEEVKAARALSHPNPVLAKDFG